MEIIKLSRTNKATLWESFNLIRNGKKIEKKTRESWARWNEQALIIIFCRCKCQKKKTGQNLHNSIFWLRALVASAWKCFRDCDRGLQKLSSTFLQQCGLFLLKLFQSEVAKEFLNSQLISRCGEVFHEYISFSKIFSKILHCTNVSTYQYVC